MMVDNGYGEVYEGFPMGIFVVLFLMLAAGYLGYYCGTVITKSVQAQPERKAMLTNTTMHCIVTNESIVTGNMLARSGDWREFDLECVEIDKP